ncbi:MAG: hypothetical protein SGI71_06340 [Verrucomicrobiota bacterium]|nr:hypothetical protein [Verrucomicrobiota bacterium]
MRFSAGGMLSKRMAVVLGCWFSTNTSGSTFLTRTAQNWIGWNLESRSFHDNLLLHMPQKVVIGPNRLNALSVAALNPGLEYAAPL